MTRFAIAAAVAALPAVAAADTFYYSDLYVFGDSFSDSGNAYAATGGTIPSGSLYFEAGDPSTPSEQFTNGDTWASQLGATPSIYGGTNFSFGGSEAAWGIGEDAETPDGIAPDFADQIDLLAGTSPVIEDDALAVIFLGGNDFLNAGSPENVLPAFADAVAAIGDGILELASMGFDDFVVFGLPNICYAPDYENPVKNCDPSLSPGDLDPLTAATMGYNQGLLGMIDGIEAVYSSLNIGYFDAFSVFEGLINSGSFANTTVDCLAVTDCRLGTAGVQDGFAFWDPVHSTRAVHAIYAEAFSRLYAPIPLPFGALLVLTGIGGLAALRRQQRAGN